MKILKIKYIFTGFIAIAILVLPGTSFANTYQFVDTGDDLQSMEASSPDVAIATAYQLGFDSGVVLATDQSSNTNTSNSTTVNYNSDSDYNYYRFIDTSGDLQGLWASNSTVAIATAHQLGFDSGVVLIE